MLSLEEKLKNREKAIETLKRINNQFYNRLIRIEKENEELKKEFEKLKNLMEIGDILNGIKNLFN